MTFEDDLIDSVVWVLRSFQEHTSIHMELHPEACQVPPRGVRQAVPTQVQGGEVRQVEQRSIERSQIIATQVDH